MWANSEMGKRFQQTGRSRGEVGVVFPALRVSVCLHMFACGWFVRLPAHMAICVPVHGSVRTWVCSCVCLHECMCLFLCESVYGLVCACGGCMQHVCVCVCVCVHTYWSASAELSQLWAAPVAGRARAEARPEHPVLSSTHSGLTCPAHLPLSSSSPSSYRSSPGTRWEQHRHRR